MEDKKYEIEKFRAQIDIIDQTILELIEKRHNISNRIGAVKKDMRMKILNPAREKELLNNIKNKARVLNLDEKHVEAVWMSIIKESRKLQKSLKETDGK